MRPLGLLVMLAVRRVATGICPNCPLGWQHGDPRVFPTAAQEREHAFDRFAVVRKKDIQHPQ